MGGTNYGTQTIIYNYKYPAKGRDFSKTFRGILKPGIYSGLTITKTGDNTVSIAVGIAVINTSTDKTVIIKTSAAFTLNVVDSAPVIYAKFDWVDSTGNYADFLTRAEGSPVTNEIILGKCNFSGSIITTIDYTDKTYGLFDSSFNMYIDNINVDTINEKTTDNGVNIEGVHFENSIIETDTINELTLNNGVNIEGVNLKDSLINKVPISLGENEISDNIAIGQDSLSNNIDGERNVAIGYQSLKDNTTGEYNVAQGYFSLKYNSTGNYNTAIGTNSLKDNTTGQGNTAVGNASLGNNSTGLYNTAVGLSSLLLNSTGTRNTGIGYYAGNSISTGSYNTCIGGNAQPTVGTVSGEFTLGDSNVTNLRCNDTSISALSDIRDKSDIKNLDIGLDFILSLKPRKFKWNRREWYAKKTKDGLPIKNEKGEYIFEKKLNKSLKSKEWTAGFISQELQETQKKFEADFLKIVNGTDYQLESAPFRFYPVLVQAIKELNEKIEKIKE